MPEVEIEYLRLDLQIYMVVRTFKPVFHLCNTAKNIKNETNTNTILPVLISSCYEKFFSLNGSGALEVDSVRIQVTFADANRNSKEQYFG
jgi:hypothetical protein